VNPQRTRLLFDENFGRLHVEGLKQFLSLNRHEPRAEIVHLFERFAPGTRDSVWIPQAAKEGFVLISSDRGKQSGKRDKLPRLCALHGLRHVLFGASMSGEKMFDKCLALLSVWYDVLDVADSDPGARFDLRSTKRGCARLESRPPPPVDPRPGPGRLF
jgi:hypothetical protein